MKKSFGLFNFSKKTKAIRFWEQFLGMSTNRNVFVY